MRSRTRNVASLGLALLLIAAVPTVADLDARSRASGNRLDIATVVGEKIFTTTWPAQVLQVLANENDEHLVLGLRLSGSKFHAPLDRASFEAEVAQLVARAFAAAPKSEEIDLWVTVPIVVGKDVVVSGDLAKPTSKTVYTITVRRGEKPAALAARLKDGAGVFLDPAWARDAFAKR